jgi:TolB protein
MKLRTTIVALTVASIVLLTAAPARATTSGKNGRIAFRRFFTAGQAWGALFTINPDGTGERQITHPHRKVLDYDPDGSPDGRWLVYAKKWALRGDRGAPRGALFRVRVNGTHRQDLTVATCMPERDCERDITPSWSPDGRRIAFSRVSRSETREYEIDIYVMRADGTHLRQVTAPGALWEDYGPQWSPNGRRLAFFRVDPDREEDADSALFTVNVDGTQLRRLTTWHLNAAQGQDWSPNGRWIAFSAWPAGQTYNLRLIHPDGTGLHRITHSRDVNWLRPCFSPDGMRIVAGRSGGAGTEGNADLYVMHLDGSHRQNITRSEDWDSAVDWGSQRQ